MKKFPAILTLTALLAPAWAAPPAPDAGSARGIGSKGLAQAVTPPADPLPAARLSEELMFKYLSAEVAEQRGNKAVAYANMFSIAKTTRDPRLARRATEIATSGKMLPEALAAARLWHEVAPRSEESAQVLLGVLVVSDRLDEVKQMLAQRMANSAPLTLAASIGQAQRLLARVQDKPRAAAILRELLEPYRDTLDAKLALAHLDYASGDATAAVREVREAAARFPKSEVAALSLAQMLEDREEGKKVLHDFLQKNPQSREVRLAYSRILFEQGKLAEAKKEFRTLLQQWPQDQTALYALGLLSAQTGDTADAERNLAAYVKALNGKPDPERDSTQALMVLAQIAEDRNDIPAALKWLDQVVTTDPEVAFNALRKRAQLVAKGGDLDGARKLLAQAQADTDSDDERARLLIGEAQLLRDSDRGADALRLLEDGLRRYPDNVELLYEHAMVAEKLEQLDLMERSLRQIIEIAPGNQQAYNALGYALADRNLRLPEAYDLIKYALTLAPEDPYIMDSMGWVEFRLGRLENAEEMLRRAYSLNPDPEIAVHLGEVLWARGREEEAKNFWRKASAKDPKNENLKGTLKRLQVKI